MSRKAFTLVELLVVIAIVLVLAAILLPAIGNAQERSRQTMCASNLRQLAIGINGYSNDHHGLMPGMGTIPQVPWDWIYWASWQGPPYNDFGQGPICRYIGKDPTLFRCPSDDWQYHVVPPVSMEQPYQPYRYSYIMNTFSQSIQRMNCCLVTDQSLLSSVKHASDKILLLEGNAETLVDGVWVPPPNLGGYWNDVGDRHDRQAGKSPGYGRANVAFADTHVEFVGPAFIHDPQHYLP